MDNPNGGSPELNEGDLREMVLRLAHEIRNPLATIKSAVQLLECICEVDEESSECYDSIHVEVGRINHVVRDLQRFMRLDEHGSAPVRVADAVAEAVAAPSVQDAMGNSEIRVLEGPDVEVGTGISLLHTALDELISNALRFSGDGAQIDVSWVHTDDNLVAISVSDDGPGIQDAHRDRILRPFFSASMRGTGLGLNIAARICHLSGGSLTWHDREGGGTTFTLRVPMIKDS